MLYLADKAHDDGSNIYPSIKTIAENTLLSERQVQRQVKALLKRGELVEVGISPLATRQFRIPMTQNVTPDKMSPPDKSSIKGVTNRAKTDVRNVTRSVRREPLDQPSEEERRKNISLLKDVIDKIGKRSA